LVRTLLIINKIGAKKVWKTVLGRLRGMVRRVIRNGVYKTISGIASDCWGNGFMPLFIKFSYQNIEQKFAAFAFGIPPSLSLWIHTTKGIS
jgi:hypothetical protein